MSDTYNYNAFHRLGVGIMLLNQDGLVFVGQRVGMLIDAWQMPQGGINDGELPIGAAKRELYEETGVVDVEVIAESKYWYEYEIPSDIAIKLWRGQYIGQRQKWFLMMLMTEDSAININMPNPEFSSWKWLNVYELPKLIVSFKKQLYIDLIEEFAPLIPSR